MKAIVILRHGGPGVLELRDAPRPGAGRGENAGAGAGARAESIWTCGRATEYTEKGQYT